jgi:DNA-binding CsgD family transcriptional regulator
MPCLTSRQLRALLNCIGEIYACQDLDGFAAKVMRVGRSAVPADFAVYDEIQLRRHRHTWLTDPPDLDLSAAPEAHKYLFEEHPFVLHLQRTGDVPPRRLSDFLSRRKYRETGLYREAYRRFGVEYQLGFTLPSPSPAWSVGLAFSRSQRDFSDEERFMWVLLRPHLFQAYRNAEIVTDVRERAAGSNMALESLHNAVIAVDAHGCVAECPSSVRRWLTEYFGQRPLPRVTLPQELQCWLSRHRLPGTRGGDLPPVRKPLIVERNGRRLTVRVLADTGRCQILAMDERPRNLSSEPIQRLGLTARQSEILLWVAQGKTNSEVGRILGLSPGTVHKHLEHVFERLGVETRTAAAARVWESIAVAADEI